MKNANAILIVALLTLFVAACSADEQVGRKVDASGKEDTALDALPEEVLAVVKATRPELEISEAEYETRDGNEYYDVGGTLPDGSELELDMTRIDGVWTVVEFQRDIGMNLVPEAVAAALAENVPDWTPTRIIESDQGDGTIIYEFFAPADDGELVKHEVKWTDGEAQLLVDEWAH
jgi:hypothetical protein